MGVVLAAALVPAHAPLLIVGITLGIFSLVLPAIVFMIGLPVLVHELGHWVAARRLGLRVVGFNVLGIAFVRNAPAVGSPDDYFGYVQVRSTQEQDRPEVWVPFLAAGPLTGLVFAGLEALLWRVDAFGLGSLIGMQALFGVSLSVASLFGRDRFPKRDGEKIRDVRKPDSQIFGQLALQRLTSFFQGADPQKYDPEDVRRALLLRDPRQRLYATSIAAARAVLTAASNAEEACRTYLDACVQAANADPVYATSDELRILRQDATLELAFCLALRNRDAKAAEDVMRSLDRIDLPFRTVAMRVESAIALAQGNGSQARRWRDAANEETLKWISALPNMHSDCAESFLRLIDESLVDDDVPSRP